MPWNVEDVKSHKKGLTPEQEKKWCDIANGVLASCKEGGDEDCDAMAIRTANSRVGVNSEQINVHFKEQTGYIPEFKEWDNRQHIIIPVVMMVEGVHNGNHGPVFHSIEELGRFVESWNGRPVTISHPKVDDKFVSANSPDVLSKWSVGHIFNTQVEDNKLKAEVWLDIERLKIVSPETFAKIQNGTTIEVSLGIFTENEDIEGDWNGEAYLAVAHNYRPDHLALLPGEVGACSINDGCGLRVNVVTTSDGTEGTVEIPVVEELEEKEKDKNKLKKEEEMCTKCPEKAKMLVDSVNTNLDETDLEWLSELTEDKLDKLIPKLNVNVEPANPPTLEEAWGIVKTGYKSLEDYTKLLPDDIREQVETGLQVFQRVRDNTITSIQANTEKDTWKNEDLEKMPLDLLQKIEKSVLKKNEIVDYSVNAIRGNNGGNEQKITPMPLPGVKFN
jgi:hypothetical protein